MTTQLLSSTQLDLAAQLLREHKLVAFPTDTIYGLGTLAFDGPTAVRLYVAKERPPEKAIPISAPKEVSPVIFRHNKSESRFKGGSWFLHIILIILK